MNKADYTYSIVVHDETVATVITDLNLGNISVTSSIEDVINEIAEKEKFNIKRYLIIYCDSMGIFDRYNFEDKCIDFLGCSTQHEAIEKYNLLQKYREQ